MNILGTNVFYRWHMMYYVSQLMTIAARTFHKYFVIYVKRCKTDGMYLFYFKHINGL